MLSVVFTWCSLAKLEFQVQNWHGFPQSHPVSGLAWYGSLMSPKGVLTETSIAYHSYWALIFFTTQIDRLLVSHFMGQTVKKKS